MIREDAVKILYRMNAAWPAMKLEDATIEVWVEHLATMSFPIATDAVRDLEASARFFPSIAEFRAAYDLAVQRDRIGRAQDRGLPVTTATTDSERVPPEKVRELIDQARRSLDAATKPKKARHP